MRRRRSGADPPGTGDYDYAAAVAADGDTLVFSAARKRRHSTSSSCPCAIPDVQPLSQHRRTKRGPALTRWEVAGYVSNESAQNEVYLRPFPALDRRIPVSTQGGTQPVWNPTGKEIFYRNGDKMMVVELTTTPEVKLSTPRVLFEQRYAYGAGITMSNFDVTADGQHFIMVKDDTGGGRLNVILNWFTELNRLAPAR